MPVTPRRSTRSSGFAPSPSVRTTASSSDVTFTWTSSAKPSTSTDSRTYYTSFQRHRVAAVGSPLTPKKKRKDDEARFAIGDGVSVALQGGNEGIGMLIALYEEPEPEDEDEDGDGEDHGTRKMATVHWFFRRQDMPSVMRNLQLEDNEVLLAASPTRPVTTELPLALLNKTVPIYSRAVFLEQFPEEETRTKWKGWHYAREGVYWCSRAYDKGARGGRVWRVDVDAWKGRGRAGEGWSVPIMDEDEEDEEEQPAEVESESEDGSVAADEGSEDEEDDEGEDEDDDEAGLPSSDEEKATVGHKRRRKASPGPDTTPRKRGRPKGSKNKPKLDGALTTPRKRGRPKGSKNKPKPDGTLTTPRKKKLHPSASTSRLPSTMEIMSLPTNPYERALRLLHVGATPESLPCREEEFIDVLSRVEEGVESGGGGCLYISGVPGTGKTATVHAVVKELKRKAEDGEIAPFSYVEINGLKIPSPQHAYSVLWEHISGQRGTSAKTALRGLEAHFGRKSGVRGPRANTYVVLMDELDQLLTAKQDVVYNFFNWPTMRDSQLFVIAIANRMDLPQYLPAKIKSRLGLQTVPFQSYTREALVEIVQSRLVAHPNSKEDHKVLMPDAIALAATKMAGTAGDARRVLDACRRAVEVALAKDPIVPVTARNMVAVLNAMSNSPVALFLKQCSTQQKRLIAAMVRCVQREGVPVVPWRSVKTDHDAITRAFVEESCELLTDAELALVRASLLATHALTAAPDSYKSAEDRGVALGMDIREVSNALMNEGDAWRRALAGT